MNIQAIQTALVAWAINSTGLAPGSVLMAEQSGVSLDELGEAPYVSIRIGQFVRWGGGDEVLSIDQSASIPAPAAGSEIAYTAVSYGTMLVNVEAYTPKSAGAGSAMDMLITASACLALPSVQTLLSSAGMSVQDAGNPISAATVIDRKWRGRARLDVSFNVTNTVTESTGYIAEVKGSSLVSGTTQTFQADRT